MLPRIRLGSVASENNKGMTLEKNKDVAKNNLTGSHSEPGLTLEKAKSKIIDMDNYSNTGVDLYVFASKLGILMTYVLLQGLRYAINPAVVDTGKNSEKGERKLELIGWQQDSMALNWIKNAVQPEIIFWQFCQLPIISQYLALLTKMVNLSTSLSQISFSG